jgi:hypothetical protein
MAAVAAAAILPYVLSGAQTLFGFAQRGASRRRRKRALEKFNYDIPSATEEQVRLAREYASRNGIPGEDVTRARFESDLAGAVSKGERAASTAEEVLGLYGKMFGKKTDFNQQLLEAGSRYKSEQEANLSKSLGLLANAEEQQFYYNKYLPFMSEMGYAADQAQGGSANIASGLQSAYSNWENQWMMDAWERIYKNNGTNDAGASPQMTIPSTSENQLSVEPWMTDSGTWDVSPEIYGSQSKNIDQNYRTPLAPWDADWQQKNPVSYPSSWIKYR